MSFSFCLNKTDTLVLCGMTLLYQSLDLGHGSKIMKDSEKYANAVIKIVDKAKAPGSLELKQIAGTLITLDDQPQPQPQPQSSFPAPARRSPDACMAAPPNRSSPPTSRASHNKVPSSLGRHASASASETDLLLKQEKLRRMTMPQLAQTRPELYRVRSRPSLDSGRHDHPLPRPDHRLSLSQAQAAQAAIIARVSPTPGTSHKQNLDYLSLASAASNDQQPSSPIQSRGQQQSLPQRQQQGPPQGQQNQFYPQRSQKASSVSTAEWEALLGSLDNGQLNLYDAIYGGPKISLTEAPAPTSNWSSDPWDLSNFNMGDFETTGASAQSVLSLSDESLSSGGEDLASSDMGLSVGSLEYANSLLPATTAGATSDGFSLDGLDDNFGL